MEDSEQRRRFEAYERIRGIFASYRRLSQEGAGEATRPQRNNDLEFERMAAVLDRYTLPWLVQVERNSFPLPKHHELIHDFPNEGAFPKWLDHIYSVPVLYRLAFLRQLSLVSVSTHFEAGHSRLSHVIGVARVASRMLIAVASEGSDKDARRIAREPVYRTACMLYAFIHDAFHGPMGHTLDIMKDVFQTSFGEKLDDNYLRKALSAAISGTDDPLGRQLFDAADRCLPGEADEVLRTIDLLSRTIQLDNEAPDLWFLRDIVDSQLDADRLDYLARDSQALLRTTEDYTHLVDSARAIRIRYENLWDREGNPRQKVHLAFHERYDTEISRALSLRRRLYNEYYEAPEKLIADNMLCHAIFYILRDKQLIDVRTGTAEEMRRRILDRILLLTDDELFSALAELHAEDLCYELLIRLRQHRYYKQVYHKGLKVQDEDRINRQLEEWQATINQIRVEWEESPGDWDDIRGVIVQKTEGLLNEEHLVVAVQRYVRPGFRDRYRIEELIWEILCELDQRQDARRDYLYREYGRADFVEINRLSDFPPVHFTTTSYITGAINRGASSRHPSLLPEYEKEHSRPQEVYIYDDAGNCRPRRIPVEGQPLLEFYPVILSAPDELCQAFSASNWRDNFSTDRLPRREDLRDVLTVIGAHDSGETVLQYAMVKVLKSLKWLRRDIF